MLPSPDGPVCGGPSSPVNNGPLVGQGTGFTANTKCVPWNVWVPNGVTPQALAFLSVPLLADGNTEEYVVDGSVTGDLGKYGAKLPWADSGLQAELRCGVASGVHELPSGRAETSRAPRPAAAARPHRSPAASHVKEVFTEMRLPLAQHQAWAEDLSLDAGYRYSKYSEGFDTNTYKFGSSGRRSGTFASAAATSARCVRRTSASCTPRRRWAWTARSIRAPRRRRRLPRRSPTA